MSTLSRAVSRLVECTRKARTLEDNGERVDIVYRGQVSFDKLDVYQKSHIRRYEFACGRIQPGWVCGDFACGTGYGSVMLAQKAAWVIGADISSKVVAAITKRYRNVANVEFLNLNLLDLDHAPTLDAIVSFETIEHLPECRIPELFRVFSNALRPGGTIIFSTPYLQEMTEGAIRMGFHATFLIDEPKIDVWLRGSGFKDAEFLYQDYRTHTVKPERDDADFTICVARKL